MNVDAKLERSKGEPLVILVEKVDIPGLAPRDTYL